MTVTAEKKAQGAAVTVLSVTNPATGQTIPIPASPAGTLQPGSVFQTRSKHFCPIVAIFLGVPLLFIAFGVMIFIGGITNPTEPDLSTPAPTNSRGEEINTLPPTTGGIFLIMFALVFIGLFTSMQVWRLTVHPHGRVEVTNVWGITLLSFQARGVERVPPGCCQMQLSGFHGVQGCATDPTSEFVVVEGASFCGKNRVAFTPQDSEGFFNAIQNALAVNQWQPGQGTNGQQAMDRV